VKIIDQTTFENPSLLISLSTCKFMGIASSIESTDMEILFHLQFFPVFSVIAVVCLTESGPVEKPIPVTSVLKSGKVLGLFGIDRRIGRVKRQD
jgi:hypothetical protein